MGKRGRCARGRRRPRRGAVAGRHGRFGRWKYSADRAATIEADASAERGGVDGCDCANCRNFRLARQEAFPAAFLRLLDQLGIDPRKDAEVYDIGGDGPGRRRYGGWYHFVGTLHETGDFPLVELAPGIPGVPVSRRIAEIGEPEEQRCRWNSSPTPSPGFWMSRNRRDPAARAAMNRKGGAARGSRASISGDGRRGPADA